MSKDSKPKPTAKPLPPRVEVFLQRLPKIPRKSGDGKAKRGK